MCSIFSFVVWDIKGKGKRQKTRAWNDGDVKKEK